MAGLTWCVRAPRQNAVQVGAINGTLAASAALHVAGDLGACVVHTHRAVADDDADLSADQSLSMAVRIRVNLARSA